MPVTMLTGGSESKKPAKTLSSVKKPSVSLPSEKTKPPQRVEDYTYFIYGVQKIGKTSFSTQFEDCLHIFLEPSGKAFELYEIHPESWAEFKAYVELLEKKKKDGTLIYKSFAIDTVDLLYAHCSTYICSNKGVEHPSDMNDYGKTWNEVEEEFRKWIIRLASLGGFIAIAHEVDKEVSTRSGNKYNMVVPSAQKKCNLILAKFCDLTGNYFINAQGQHVLRILPSEEMESGNRIDTEKNPRFRWKGTKERIAEIPMGNSSEEAFNNFSLAFQNQLEKPKEVIKEKPSGVTTEGNVTGGKAKKFRLTK